MSMYSERKRRTFLKTLSWRVLATVTTVVIVYIFTGKLVLAATIGGVEVLAKLVLYFFHERVWNKIAYGKKAVDPFVLWFTGLSGAGKSTLADLTYDYLEKRGYRVERLDGDIVRNIFPKTGFTKEERDNHIKRIGYLSSTLEQNGVIVVSSFISPYRDARAQVRKHCNHFVEVFVKADLATCEKRDVKGLYKKARSGEIKHFTGIDDPYEDPIDPEVIIETDNDSVEQSFSKLTKEINKFLKGDFYQ